MFSLSHHTPAALKSYSLLSPTTGESFFSAFMSKVDDVLANMDLSQFDGPCTLVSGGWEPGLA